jgi:hypothetical protein
MDWVSWTPAIHENKARDGAKLYMNRQDAAKLSWHRVFWQSALDGLVVRLHRLIPAPADIITGISIETACASARRHFARTHQSLLERGWRWGRICNRR